MNENVMGAAVKLVCDGLSDDELLAMNICAQLGTDPRPCTGWEKAKPLFTSRSAGGTPLVRSVTQEWMASVVLQRLEKAERGGVGQ